MDVNAVTAALQDLLGPGLAWSDYGYWETRDVWEGYNCLILPGGAVQVSQKEVHRIPPAVLDKLHAASQIVRRMVTP